MSRGLRVEACVLDNSLAAFTVARKEDKDDPLSLMFCFEGNERKPWLGWVELPRFITSLASLPSADGEKEFFRALSNEGDIYVIDYDETPTEKIEGAGFLSEDSGALGYCLALARGGKHLFACGNGSQVYVRNGKGEWSASLASIEKLGDCSFRAISGRSPKDIVVGGYTEPVYDRELTVAGRAHVQRLRELGYPAVLQSGGTVRDAEGCLFSYDGKTWKRLPWPKEEQVAAIVEIGKTRLAIGQRGSVFAIAGSKLTRLAGPTKEHVLKTLVLKDEIYLLGLDSIGVLDKKGAVVRTIPLPSAPNVSGTMAAGAGLLWYFDTLGVARWIKGKWQRVPFDAANGEALAQLEPPKRQPAPKKKKAASKKAAPKKKKKVPKKKRRV